MRTWQVLPANTAEITAMKPSGITVLFFARGRELAGVSEVMIDLKRAPDTAQLIQYLLLEYPRLSEIMATAVLSLNQEYLDPDPGNVVPLKNGDEVAVIPPVSGG